MSFGKPVHLGNRGVQKKLQGPSSCMPALPVGLPPTAHASGNNITVRLVHVQRLCTCVRCCAILVCKTWLGKVHPPLVITTTLCTRRAESQPLPPQNRGAGHVSSLTRGQLQHTLSVRCSGNSFVLKPLSRPHTPLLQNAALLQPRQISLIQQCLRMHSLAVLCVV